jgi:GNAT superfamily N-acetyltransferase
VSASEIYTYSNGEFTISTDTSLLDIGVIHNFLAHSSYWRPGVPEDLVIKSIQNSFCFGLYHSGQQIGFAGVVTDFTHFAYLQDVFVLEAYRGNGLGQWLVDCILKCPALDGVGRILLATGDAHEFYRNFGFVELSSPERWMEKRIERAWFRPLN